jgi:EAL domain-containing protein (putative c-di-GMP-specific phosphodiesterase class I)
MRAGDQSRPAFFEGLIRVMDPTGRVIPAREFIGAVENHEMGRVLDCLALEMGLIALQNTPGLRLSINMSARSIGYRRWMETLEAGLRGNPTVAERLILEITESSCIVMPDVVQAFMADLQLRGICFAMDDFGSGYTAFKYFRDFDFDMLKIDGSFIRGIDRNPDNQVLVQALVGIARHFDMFTVAEFVETAQEAEFLTSIGVDCLQGYHFGAPELRPEWQTRQTSRLVS